MMHANKWTHDSGMKPLSLEPSKSNTNATTRPLLTHVLPNLLNAAQYCPKVTAATRCAAEDSEKEPDLNVRHEFVFKKKK